MTNATPTVALVHGAFADSTGWSGVVEGLMAAGVPVTSISNPLRGIAEDSAYVASALGQIPGPVLAVGHSYGGGGLPHTPGQPRHTVGPLFPPPVLPGRGGGNPPPPGGAAPNGPENGPG